jgi:hypothetical protein
VKIKPFLTLLSIALALIACTAWLATQIMNDWRKAATYSFVASANACLKSDPSIMAFAMGTDAENVVLWTGGVNSVEAWVLLPQHQVALVLERCGGRLDTTRLRTDGTPVDPWGVPYQIAVREHTDGHIEFRVFSTGRDKKPFTANDVGW